MADRPSKKNGDGYDPSSDRLRDLDPDQLPLTENRARHLADLSGLPAEKLAGQPLAEVHELLKWKVDPQLLFFRYVCGRVVRRDPVTGELQPVANATVHVEDTDCSYLGYFPQALPYVWLYPFNCRREVIATVTTDSCGEFCVHLPFWDVDRILRWRRTHICYWEWFRPRLRDLLIDPDLLHPIPRPLPDPPPFTRIGPEALERVRDLAGPQVAERLEAARTLELQGEGAMGLEALLDEPVFAAGKMPPPLPEELRDATGGQEGSERVLASIGDRELTLSKLDFRRFVGPYLRCRDIWIGTFHTVLDVPDITFRVTQDVDGDGTEEVIYSEGHFDVRWNSGSIPNVTLEASGNALPSLHCGPSVPIPCSDTPSIESAGYLDLEPAYHNDATGYAVRVNRPSPTGDYLSVPSDGSPSATPATAPYAGNLNLHGCARIGDATHYRLKYEYRHEDGDPWGPETIIKGVVWTAPGQGPGPSIPFIPDADGWYSLAVDPDDLVHPNWLLPWNTAARPDGLYRLHLELGVAGGGGITPQGTSAERVFRVDNSSPQASLVEVRWRPAGTIGPWNDFNSTVVLPAPPSTCPVIHRPTGQDIHLRVVWTAGAEHLRDASLGHSGCGGGGLVPLESIPEDYQHWHTGPADNAVAQTNSFLLPASRPPGCYTLSVSAHSRAFNPQDYNAASIQDWWVRMAVRWSRQSRAISVVDV